ncbi:hypothetical protein GCM10023074_43860 [Microbispora amethystogenes]|uniref:Uncharacterized protein n=1 Tax=Microbispora amethystogenes TaxID=1427754 RepID=A0ABQ4FP74_9ACTN|nr:hypothetical protein Mam01_67730 [Microbispora amethystogenes]
MITGPDASPPRAPVRCAVASAAGSTATVASTLIATAAPARATLPRRDDGRPGTELAGTEFAGSGAAGGAGSLRGFDVMTRSPRLDASRWHVRPAGGERSGDAIAPAPALGMLS